MRGKGAMRLIGGDGVRISRKGIVRARGVCGMECAEVAPRRLRRGHSACGAETPRTELREQGYVCGGMPGQGAGRGFGRRRSRGLDRLELWRLGNETCENSRRLNSTRRLCRLPDRRNLFSVAAWSQALRCTNA